MPRTPRYERHPELVPFRFNADRDPEIIKTVYDYRFISSEQAQVVIERSDQMILRRLQKLFHHDYLDRMDKHLNTNENVKMIYALADEGADVVAKYYGVDRGKINWCNKNKEIGRRYLEHSLMISNFRACLTAALESTPNAKLLFWVRENPQEVRDYVYVTEKGKKKKFTVVPDGFFQIEHLGWKTDFFLEADRGTTTHRRFFNKMRAYFLMWRETQLGRHRNPFGVKNFRVLTVTETRRRMNNLMELTREADDRQAGSYMFWFATEEYFNLKDPGTVLGNIWQTSSVKDRELHSLLE